MGMMPPMRLNGSLPYLPALIALTVFAGLTFYLQYPAHWLVSDAVQIFLLSLVFRTIDLGLCDVTGSLSTHFIWYLLNGLLVGLPLQTLVLQLPPLCSEESISSAKFA